MARHSQGSIVSTHLLDRLVGDGHIFTSRNLDPEGGLSGPGNAARTCCGGEAVPFFHWSCCAGEREEEEEESAASLVWDSFGPVEVFELEYACWALSVGS